MPEYPCPTEDGLRHLCLQYEIKWEAPRQPEDYLAELHAGEDIESIIERYMGEYDQMIKTAREQLAGAPGPDRFVPDPSIEDFAHRRKAVAKTKNPSQPQSTADVAQAIEEPIPVPTAEEMGEQGEDESTKFSYQVKALLEHYGFQIPDDVDEIEAISGAVDELLKQAEAAAPPDPVKVEDETSNWPDGADLIDDAFSIEEQPPLLPEPTPTPAPATAPAAKVEKVDDTFAIEPQQPPAPAPAPTPVAASVTRSGRVNFSLPS
jgi:hypothetical protein